MILKNSIFLGLLLLGSLSLAANTATEVRSADTEIVDDPFEDTAVSTVNNDIEEKALTDSNQGVLRKRVNFNKSFQIDLSSGLMPEEITSNSKYSLVRISYFANDNYGFGLGVKTRFGDRTDESQSLLNSAQQIDFDRAPVTKNAAFVSFGYNLLYGKISLTKNIVPATLTQIKTDFGLQNYSSVNRPFIRTALDQSFFVFKRLALGFGIGLDIAEITDATSVNVNQSQAIPNESSFATKIQFNYFYSLNLNVIL